VLPDEVLTYLNPENVLQSYS